MENPDDPDDPPVVTCDIPSATSPVTVAPDAATTAELYFARQENAKLKQQLTEDKERMRFSKLREMDTLVFKYTSLPTAAEFDAIVSVIQRFSLTYYMGWKVEALDTEDQLLVTLMKLRLNLPLFDLAYRFKISDTTVQNIFLTLVDTIHHIFLQGMRSLLADKPLFL